MKNLVIIPTYNEKENIQRILNVTLNLPSKFDVLVVDDSSPDGTASLVQQLQPNFPERLFLEVRKDKNGLAQAYIHGFKWAIRFGYDTVFEMDADFSHNPNDLSKLLKELEKDADMVVGSRYIKGVNVVNWPLYRVLLSYFASKYVRFILTLPITDSTAGFVGYKIDVLREINLDNISLKGYGFQVEMKYKTWKLGHQIKEISIIFTDRELGESKINKSIIFEAVWGIAMLRIKKLFNRL